MKKLIIIGGTGTVGLNFCKYALKNNMFHSITIFSRNEKNQVIAKRELDSPLVNFVIGDVRDKDALRNAIRGCTHIVNTAAIKHIELAEENYDEAIKTNIIGAQNVADIIKELSENSIINNIYISTDKAATPNSLYGASKLVAEKIFININGKNVRSSCIRLGNILGSSGSILEYWSNNIGKQIYLSDRDLERYFIKIDTVCSFIDFTFKEMSGGEIFIPLMNKYKIRDIARLFSENIIENELRPGEKISEVLYSSEEANRTIVFDHHYLIKPNNSINKHIKYGKNIKFDNSYATIDDIRDLFGL
jgi:UDP-N-acetylglucosamine 4,6-dehydratase/5-epimerase